MNDLIKVVTCAWILICAVITWASAVIIGFWFVLSDYHFVYSIMPFIGFTAAFCMIKCAMYVLLKSNPMAYIKSKFNG